jgi:hypothetical protein
MNVLLDSSAQPPLFRFSTDVGGPVRLLEVRITELGEADPSWWLVHRDATIEDAVSINIMTAEEAERAGIPTVRNIENDLAHLVADIGVPVAELRYGEVPEGFKQQGSLQQLRQNRLYQLIAVGSTVGELEFYG